jgi:hypothetical protein
MSYAFVLSIYTDPLNLTSEGKLRIETSGGE